MSSSNKINTELVYGVHTIDAILQRSPQRITHLYLQQGRQDQTIQGLLQFAKSMGLPVETVTKQTLEKWLPKQNHQGIVARCRPMSAYSKADLGQLLDGLTVPPLLLVLDGVQDPHNLGACLRTADAAGVHAVIAPKDHSVGLTPTVCKVAAGAAEAVPFFQVTNLARTLRWLKERGIWLFGTDDSEAVSLYQSDLSGALAIVMGAEGKGLRRLTKEVCDAMLVIPMAGTVSSLNVSVATGVCLYEAVRQRHVKAQY